MLCGVHKYFAFYSPSESLKHDIRVGLEFYLRFNIILLYLVLSIDDIVSTIWTQKHQCRRTKRIVFLVSTDV